MRSIPRSLSFGAQRGARRVAPLEAFSRTEKIIAFCRVLLAIATLTVVVVDPKRPSLGQDLAYVVLSAYVAYSALLFVLVRGEHLRQERVGPYSAAADVTWITLITVFTEGGTSPFFLLHVFLISSVSVRWGLRATMAITVVLAALYPAVLFLASHWIGSEDLVLRRAHLFRLAYLLVLGYLIGYLGEHERRSKRKGTRPSHLYLIVRDNGLGFPNSPDSVDADGFLAPAAAPWSIRERSAALGGLLRVWSQPGRGAEISVMIPAGGRAVRHNSDRRMHA